MKVSDKGLQFVARMEGRRFNSAGEHVPYRDVAGNWTIGYGHLLAKGGSLPPGFSGASISEASALSLLRDDLIQAEKAINLAIRPPLIQHQYDALASWFFNLGLNQATFQSNLVKLINSPVYWEALGDGCKWVRAAISEEFGRWNKAGGKVVQGLRTRRALEAWLWNEGKYE